MMDSVKVTLIATKFDDQRVKLFRFKKDETISSFSKPSPEATTLNEKTLVDDTSPKIDIADDEELLDESDTFDVPAFQIGRAHV